ncbi:hypothetical protein K1Y78_28145 [Streptomyces sp. tea 10]|nr:hypothetical protein [Streptomyces sp. tea 10]
MRAVGEPPSLSSAPVARRLLLGAALVSVAQFGVGCGDSHKKPEAAGSPTVHAADGTVVMVIRHGEKPTSGLSGMDDSGRPDSKSLTARGWERAHALPKLFSPPRAGLARPATVFAAADQGPNAGAHRMRQTVTPLAKDLGLTVDTDFAEGSERRLAQAALTAPGPVLICWEHSRIPAVVAGLGAADAPGTPATWPDRFDLVWVFRRRSGSWSFTQVDQHLLPGDR